MNFIRAYSDFIYCYVTNISFLKPPVNYKLQNAPRADEYSVHEMTSDTDLMCDLSATVNVYRAACSLSNADSLFSQTFLRYVCLMSVSVTQNK